MVGKTALNKEMKHLNGAYFRTITDNLIQKYMEYIPDYLKPFIIHKDYFPELIEDSWFNNPVYWKDRLISL